MQGNDVHMRKRVKSDGNKYGDEKRKYTYIGQSVEKLKADEIITQQLKCLKSNIKVYYIIMALKKFLK